MDRKKALFLSNHEVLGVREHLCNIDIYICGEIDNIVSELLLIKEKYFKIGYRNLMVEFNIGHEHTKYSLYGVRDETSQEKTIRLLEKKKEEEAKLYQQKVKMEKEIKRYEYLKEKKEIDLS